MCINKIMNKISNTNISLLLAFVLVGGLVSVASTAFAQTNSSSSSPYTGQNTSPQEVAKNVTQLQNANPPSELLQQKANISSSAVPPIANSTSSTGSNSSTTG
jgi:hypothetical protein